MRSVGAPGYDAIHFDLETGFDVSDGYLQQRGQVYIQVDLNPELEMSLITLIGYFSAGRSAIETPRPPDVSVDTVGAFVVR
jgi:hypothetical protein